LQVLVEPRMLIRNDGPLKDLVVVDDLGQSLVTKDPNAEEDRHDFGFTPAAYVLGRMPLRRTERPGRVIKTLRGVAPVSVAKPRTGFLEIPLDGEVGRSFRADDSIVTLRAVRKIVPEMRIIIESVDPKEKRADPEAVPQATEIELAIRPIDGRRDLTSAMDLSENQFEILDADGQIWKPSPWWMSDARPQLKDGESHLRLTPVDKNLVPWNGELKGAKLHYHEMVVVRVEVPFEFADVTLP
jgi:hypothetical protein